MCCSAFFVAVHHFDLKQSACKTELTLVSLFSSAVQIYTTRWCLEHVKKAYAVYITSRLNPPEIDQKYFVTTNQKRAGGFQGME